tara:strand:+ start:206 stop:442 length:237 start_codon:yes stop_codon:yes gene_type:complete
MTPLEKAEQLYTQAYRRWALELSHDKNEIIAKDISVCMCNEVLSYMGADRGTEFWASVRKILVESQHLTLYKPNPESD